MEYEVLLSQALWPPIRSSRWDFSGGSVVKNLPAKTGDMASIPGPAGSYKQLSPCIAVEPLCSRAREPQLLSPQASAPEARELKSRHRHTKEVLGGCDFL